MKCSEMKFQPNIVIFVLQLISYRYNIVRFKICIQLLSVFFLKPDETLKKLNEVLNSLEGAYFNHSSAETNMKVYH